VTNGEKRTVSPWTYVGIGCGVVVLLSVIAIGACSWFGWRFAKQKAQELETELKDPAARESKALELLGASQLPEGYFPALSLSVPFVMEMVSLTDRPPAVDQKRIEPAFDERSFTYIHLRPKKADDPRLRDFFEGRTDDSSVLKDAGVNFELGTGQILKRGVIDGSPRLMYAVQRGRSPLQRAAADGLACLILIGCPGDDSLRIAIWTGPDPAPSAALDPAPAGSVADESAIASFMGQFSLCR
jgi:hypothetical protein